MSGMGIMLAVLALAAGGETSSKDGPTPEDVRAAVGRSLPFLESGGTAWMKTKGCVSCHHVPMMLWTHHEAHTRGFSVNAKAVDEAEHWALEQYLAHPQFMPTGQDQGFPKRGPGPGAVYLAIGAGAAGRESGPAAEALGKLGGHFLKMQEGDGSWAMKLPSAPLVDGDDVATSLILLALDVTPDTDAAREGRRRALEWLGKTPARDETQPLALRTLVAARSGLADRAKASADRLRARQQKDGGWAQVDGRPSDALATGQALCALAAVGASGDSASVRRARRFLLGSQKGDGSWLVKTRNPNSHDVIISYYGTGWATLGLIRSLPTGGSARRDRGPGEGPPKAQVGAGATR